MKEMMEASKVALTISVGDWESYFIRTASSVVGLSVKLEVLTARKVIIERLAFGLLLNFFISSIALIPIGVAALPSPKKLAVKLDKIYPMAG